MIKDFIILLAPPVYPLCPCSVSPVALHFKPSILDQAPWTVDPLLYSNVSHTYLCVTHICTLYVYLTMSFPTYSYPHPYHPYPCLPISISYQVLLTHISTSQTCKNNFSHIDVSLAPMPYHTWHPSDTSPSSYPASWPPWAPWT